ncbi:MAG: tRNA (adenosine(37)-N6)-threonylcarbamoyltransferase complex transferase subunit TsaD [Armatimonadetes bacterium]|nr:tRNA (adenosine(37)-N6)-threonylcarbamoyltransferase complex transferase subunit TsaD [Armatimonadota bacterium]
MDSGLTFFARPVLAIETSCDETSVAVLSGDRVLANVVSSQAELHEKWGGVVPEAASRAHVEAILPVLEEALAISGLREFGAIAVTNRPGLVGALSVGVTAAKSLAYAWGIPLIGVNHLEGHLCSVYAGGGRTAYPCLTLMVSGGHTELVLVRGPLDYVEVGHTIDDAAGEAFDKGSRLLGLGYPGGRAIQEAARSGSAGRYPLPKGLSGDTLDFSFSGLKTAMRRLVETHGSAISVPDAAASLQRAIVSVLVERTARAAERFSAASIALVGGVAANEALRAELGAEAARMGLAFSVPAFDLCTDNAAMIGIAGSLRLARGERDDFGLDVFPNAALPR